MPHLVRSRPGLDEFSLSLNPFTVVFQLALHEIGPVSRNPQRDTERSRVVPARSPSLVQRLANDSIRSKQMDNLSSSDELISILDEEFNNVATVLESYLSCPDHLQQI